MNGSRPVRKYLPNRKYIITCEKCKLGNVARCVTVQEDDDHHYEVPTQCSTGSKSSSGGNGSVGRSGNSYYDM